MNILGVIVELIFLGLICYILYWGWTKISPKVPDPWNTVIFVLGIMLICAVLINFMLGLGGVTFNGPLFHWRN